MELTELETTSLSVWQKNKNTVQWEKEECCEKGEKKKGKPPENFPIFILLRRGPQN